MPDATSAPVPTTQPSSLPSEVAANDGLQPLSAIFEAPSVKDAVVKAETAPAANDPKKAPSSKETPRVDTKGASAEKKDPAKAVPPAVVDDPEAYSKGLSDKSRARFVEMSNKRAEQLFEERMKGVTAPKVEDSDSYKTLASQKAELEAKLTRFGVEHTPEYQAKFVERPKQIREAISGILETYDIDKNAFFKAMENPNDKTNRVRLNQLMEEVGRLDVIEASHLVNEYMELEKARATVQSDPKLALDKLQAEASEKTRKYVETVEKSRQAALDPLLEAFDKDQDGFFSSEEGQTEKANIIKMVRQYAGTDLEIMPPDARARLLMSAFLSVPLNRALATAQAEVAELRGRLDKYEKGEPALGGPGRISDVPEEDNRSLAERIFGAGAGR